MVIDEAKLQTIKTDIRSVLVLSPFGVTVRGFLQDYENFYGNTFPFKDFGHNSPLDFLKSLPDVARLTYSKNELLIAPVASENSTHIKNLVANQRKETTKKRRCNPRTRIVDNRKYYQVVNKNRNTRRRFGLMDVEGSLSSDLDDLDGLQIEWTTEKPKNYYSRILDEEQEEKVSDLSPLRESVREQENKVSDLFPLRESVRGQEKKVSDLSPLRQHHAGQEEKLPNLSLVRESLGGLEEIVSNLSSQRQYVRGQKDKVSDLSPLRQSIPEQKAKELELPKCASKKYNSSLKKIRSVQKNEQTSASNDDLEMYCSRSEKPSGLQNDRSYVQGVNQLKPLSPVRRSTFTYDEIFALDSRQRYDSSPDIDTSIDDSTSSIGSTDVCDYVREKEEKVSESVKYKKKYHSSLKGTRSKLKNIQFSFPNHNLGMYSSQPSRPRKNKRSSLVRNDHPSPLNPTRQLTSRQKDNQSHLIHGGNQIKPHLSERQSSSLQDDRSYVQDDNQLKSLSPVRRPTFAYEETFVQDIRQIEDHSSPGTSVDGSVSSIGSTDVCDINSHSSPLKEDSELSSLSNDLNELMLDFEEPSVEKVPGRKKNHVTVSEEHDVYLSAFACGIVLDPAKVIDPYRKIHDLNEKYAQVKNVENPSITTLETDESTLSNKSHESDTSLNNIDERESTSPLPSENSNNLSRKNLEHQNLPGIGRGAFFEQFKQSSDIKLGSTVVKSVNPISYTFGRGKAITNLVKQINSGRGRLLNKKVHFAGD